MIHGVRAGVRNTLGIVRRRHAEAVEERGLEDGLSNRAVGRPGTGKFQTGSPRVEDPSIHPDHTLAFTGRIPGDSQARLKLLQIRGNFAVRGESRLANEL